MSDVKIGFVTCVQLGLSCMEALYDAGGSLSVAISLNDDQAVNKSGRVYIDSFCENHSVPLVKSGNVNNQVVIDAIKAYKLDWLFIIGWSQIAKSELLGLPLKGVLGMHPTLLPIGRGRAAIPWAILKNLTETGVTLFKLEEGVDTGPISIQKKIKINPGCTAEKLYEKVEVAHIELMKEVIPLLLNDDLPLYEQNNDEATEWLGRKPEDGEIDLTGSVYDADRLVRAVTKPYPGAFYVNDNSKKKVIVWSAHIAKEATDNYIEFFDGFLILDKFE